MLLLILKYTASVFFGFGDEEKAILDNPKPLKELPELQYTVGSIYNLNEEPYLKLQRQICKF